MKMITPPYLVSGDKIAIVASARFISPEELQSSVEFIQNQGFEVLKAPNLFKQNNQFAGTDVERASDLQWAINKSDVKAILFARGGYGSVRIIDLVDFTPLIKNPKWLIGYSDITVIHARLQSLSIQSIHATMPISFNKDIQSAEALMKTLKGEPISYLYSSKVFNHLQTEGEVTGKLFGGNLSLLYALQGSKDEVMAEGGILFLEDLDEYLYHIDRMVVSLKRSGLFNRIKGLILGGFTEMKDNTVPFGLQAEEIIKSHVPSDMPLITGFPAGHTKVNMPIVFGHEVKLTYKNGISELKFY